MALHEQRPNPAFIPGFIFLVDCYLNAVRPLGAGLPVGGVGKGRLGISSRTLETLKFFRGSPIGILTTVLCKDAGVDGSDAFGALLPSGAAALQRGRDILLANCSHKVFKENEMKQQSGFTLIELIVVIVILGILAATALPKFTNMTVDARVAKMQGVAASLKGTAAMAHGAALAENIASAGNLALENGTLVSLVNYYPAATNVGILLAMDSTGVSAAVVGTDQMNFASDSSRASCVVTYKQTNTTSSVPTIDDSWVTSSALYNQYCI